MPRSATLAVALAGLVGLAGCLDARTPPTADPPASAPPAATTAPTAPPTGPFGIRNAAELEPGIIVAGQPTEEQLRAVVAAGYRTVIDLRTPEENRGFDEKALLEELAIPYVTIPVGAGGPDAAAVERLTAALRTAERPILLHCASSNRVGALLYPWFVAERGLAPEEAMKRARAAGLRSPELAAQVEALARASATAEGAD